MEIQLFPQLDIVSHPSPVMKSTLELLHFNVFLFCNLFPSCMETISSYIVWYAPYATEEFLGLTVSTAIVAMDGPYCACLVLQFSDVM